MMVSVVRILCVYMGLMRRQKSYCDLKRENLSKLGGNLYDMFHNGEGQG